MEAACSEAPSASDWLAEETWLETETNRSEESVRPWMTCCTGRVIERAMKTPAPTMTSPTMVTTARRASMAFFSVP